MNTKMLNAFLLFSRKRNNKMSCLDSCKVWKHLQTLYTNSVYRIMSYNINDNNRDASENGQ